MKKTHLLPLVLLLGAVLLIAGTIDLSNLYNYGAQGKPAYINKDNTPVTNPITDARATLGRVLFYDKKLSANNSIACASCHIQAFAFSDTAVQSIGLDGGLTGRHSMRLVNARYGTSPSFFWDERSPTLEHQVTQPIQDHVEMGFGGFGGQPDMDSLIRKMNTVSYYPQLFQFAFGSPQITETKMQQALAQFVRSIQSFDSKFDIGRAQVQGQGMPFPNFTANENAGKQIFMHSQGMGTPGCQTCHRMPEFDIDPLSLNNGVISKAGDQTGLDLTNTRAPSLRNLFNPSGSLNGPMMHNGAFTTIEQVIEHYNLIPQNPANTNLDPRLNGPGGNLQLTALQKTQLADFLRTLTGVDVFTNPKWSDPFDASGNITILGLNSSIYQSTPEKFTVFPNPASEYISLKLPEGRYNIHMYGINGQLLYSGTAEGSDRIDLPGFASGFITIQAVNQSSGWMYQAKFIKK
jgi:cytochrome c peroxidase